jgi:hypothetical protein
MIPMIIEKNKIYNLMAPLKGWPVKEAEDLQEAAQMILGSPYWDIPQDIYRVIDKNETYSLLAVYRNGRTSFDDRYLALNMKLSEMIKPVG